jgi:hypothetical protein
VDPNGELLVETLYPIAVATIDEAIPGSARKRYPGYLSTPSGL